MATPARYYSSVAQQTALTASITPSTTTIMVASTTGFPGSTPFTLALDYGAANEELVDVQSVAGLSLVVSRSVDGTPASSHNAGAVVRHVSSGRDFAESRAHEVATEDVHGVTGLGNDLVGTTSTQTLSNKTLNRATGTLQRVDIFNTGNWTTSVIGDSANPNFNRFHVLDNEINLNEMFAITATGNIYGKKNVSDTDGTYRMRITDSNGTTDRFAILAGGTVGITPTSTTTFPPVDITSPDTSTTKRAIRVAASGGGTERFTVWNDGHVDIQGFSTAVSILDVTGPAAHAAAYARILDGSANTLWTVGSTGKEVSAATLDVRNDFHTGGVSTPVLRVFGRQPGQTGDLQQWVNASNAIVCSISAAGVASFSGINQTSSITTTSTVTGNNVTATNTVSGANVTASNFVRGGNIRAGSASTPTPGGDGVSSVNVTFSSAMASTPRVVATPNSSVDPGPTDPQRRIWWVVDNVSATGFTLRAYRSSASSTNFDWIAIAE